MEFFWIANPDEWENALAEAWGPNKTPKEILRESLVHYRDLRSIDPPRSAALNANKWKNLIHGKAPEAVRLVENGQITDLLAFPVETISELVEYFGEIEVVVGDFEPSEKLAPKKLDLAKVAIA